MGHRQLGGEQLAVSRLGLSGRVRVREYDVSDIKSSHEDWGSLSGAARLRRLAAVTPRSEHTTTNVVLNEYLEHLVDVADPGQPDAAQAITHFAVGTDGTDPQSTDGGLLSEVFRGELDTEADQGTDFAAAGILDQNEANGNTLREVALTTGPTSDSEAFTVNRALISATDKTQQKIVTIDFTLQYRDGG